MASKSNNDDSLKSYGFLKINNKGSIVGISITDLEKDSAKYEIDKNYHEECKVIIPGLKPFDPDSSQLSTYLASIFINTSVSRVLLNRGGNVKILATYTLLPGENESKKVKIESMLVTSDQ